MKKNKRKPAAIDLFCGAGGLSDGFKQAGYKILLGLDNVEVFVKTFKRNHRGAAAVCEDIRDLSAEKIKKIIGDKKVDVIIGGPPCQGFSMAGRRDFGDPRNSLFMEFVKIVRGIKPEYFVMENVPGILSMKTAHDEPVVDIIKKEFKKIRYNVELRQLLAADYGVPQKRRRLIFIGAKNMKTVTFPQQTHFGSPQHTLLKKNHLRWIPVKKVLLNENEVGKNFFHSQKMIEGFIRRKQKNTAKGNGFGWQILRPDEPSFTISARYWKDGADALVKYSEKKIRMLTPLECARIQSFRDGFKFLGNKKQVYIQIGNAVPPRLAKAIALKLKKKLI